MHAAGGRQNDSTLPALGLRRECGLTSSCHSTRSTPVTASVTGCCEQCRVSIETSHGSSSSEKVPSIYLNLQPHVHLAEESFIVVVGVEDELCELSIVGQRETPDHPELTATSGCSPTVPAPRYPTALAAFLASSYKRSRNSCGRPGAGASSMIFWWRRWTEQSRSKRER